MQIDWNEWKEICQKFPNKVIYHLFWKSTLLYTFLYQRSAFVINFSNFSWNSNSRSNVEYWWIRKSIAKFHIEVGNVREGYSKRARFKFHDASGADEAEERSPSPRPDFSNGVSVSPRLAEQISLLLGRTRSGPTVSRFKRHGRACCSILTRGMRK